MKADYHMHTEFSSDSQTPMEDMIRAGIQKGFQTLCFTEHMDMDFPEGELDFQVDMPAYQSKCLELKEKYKDSIEVLFGIELGLQKHLGERLKAFVESYPFDFVIGSSHVVHGMDPYYPEFFEGREEKDAYREYFRSVVENIHAFDGIDAYGHIDYVVRYGPNKNKDYSYEVFRQELDEILRLLIEKQIALEVNSGGYKYGLGEPNPSREVIRRYRKMGGELVTIGSDAHQSEFIGYEFGRIKDFLKECGFTYYTEFRRRTPISVKI